MDFDFSPEEQQLKDQARRYLADHCPSTASWLCGPSSTARTALLGQWSAR